jgi:YVTN family beta-propeller protein
VLLNSSITRFDATSGNQVGVIEGLECVCAIGAGEDGVWFSELDLIGAKAYVMRLSTRGAPRVEARVEIPNPIPDAGHGRWAFIDLAVGDDAVWLIDDTLEQRLWRIDSKANRVEATVELGFPPRSIAVGEGAVWVTDQLGDSVARIDPTTNRIVSKIPVGRGARGVEVAAGSVWVANSLDGTVSRIDPAANVVTAVIETGPGPVEIAAGDGFIWVATDGR